MKRIKAKDGRKVKQNKPIYTFDPNDPRIGNYNDSLTVSNTAQEFADATESGKYTYEELRSLAKKQAPKVIPAYNRLKKLNKGKGINSIEDRHKDLSEFESMDYQLYQPPVQPYKFIGRQNIEALPISQSPLPVPNREFKIDPVSLQEDEPNYMMGSVDEYHRRLGYQNKMRYGGKMKRKAEFGEALSGNVPPTDEYNRMSEIQGNSLQLNVNDPMNINSWNPSGGFNTNDALAGSFQAIAGLIPNTPIKDNKKNLIEGYNPFPQGTGSHATFKKGGRIRRKAQNGLEVPVSIQERNNFEKLQGFAYQQPGFAQNPNANHNSELGLDLINQYNTANPNNQFDPNRLGAIQQDFLNLGNTDPSRIRAGKEGLSKADNFYGTKTNQQRYTNYAYKHYNKKGNLIADENFGTDKDAMYAFRNNENTNNDFQPIANNENVPQDTFTPNIDSMNRDKMFPTLAQAKTNKRKQNSNWHTNEETNYLFKNGGYIPQGKDGLYVEDGNVSEIGNNRFTGNTVQFNGPSHDKGGIDINFDGTPVEVEGGETGFVDNSGNMNIFGNLYIPGTNTKFKTAGKDIAKQEKKADRLGEKGTNLINENDPTKKLQNPSFNTGAVLQDAYKQRQQKLAMTKEYLADVQNNILDVADYMKKDPKQISKELKGKAEFGKRIAKNGDSLYNDASFNFTGGPSNSVINSLPMSGYRPSAYSSDEAAGLEFLPTDRHQVKMGPNPMDYQENFNEIDVPSVDYSQQTGDLTNGIGQSIFKNTSIQKLVQNKRGRFLRDRLGFSDILPELSQLFDQPDAVPGQQFNPSLYSPYSVSFDERKAGNRASFNAIQKTMANNPAALGALSAQSYDADNQINAEEFRTNQAIQNDVINRNNQLMNQAGLTNLQLTDQQMVRKTQALENTKENRFNALQSLSTKNAQKRRENRTLQIYEDMFHYGYDPNARTFDYIGKPFELPNTIVGLQQPDQKKLVKKRYDYNSYGDKTGEVDETYEMGGILRKRRSISKGKY